MSPLQVTCLERSNQAAQLAELRAAKALADKRLARLRELSDTVPRKEIEASESEVSSLTGRVSAMNIGLNSRDALVVTCFRRHRFEQRGNWSGRRRTRTGV